MKASAFWTKITSLENPEVGAETKGEFWTPLAVPRLRKFQPALDDLNQLLPMLDCWDRVEDVVW